MNNKLGEDMELVVKDLSKIYNSKAKQIFPLDKINLCIKKASLFVL